MYVIRFNNSLYDKRVSQLRYTYVGNSNINRTDVKVFDNDITPYNILSNALQFDSVSEAEAYYKEHKNIYKSRYPYLYNPCVMKIIINCKLNLETIIDTEEKNRS